MNNQQRITTRGKNKAVSCDAAKKSLAYPPSPTTKFQQDSSKRRYNNIPLSPLQTNRCKSSADASRIRSRFLHRLGIPPSDSKAAASPLPPRFPSPFSPPSFSPISSTRKEPLKNDGVNDENARHSASTDGDDALSTASTSSLTLSEAGSCTSLNDLLESQNNSSSKPAFETSTTRKVSFRDAVTVHYIPKRNEYSSRIQRTIWFSRKEATEMIRRNAVEFEYENYNTDTVLEECDFYTLDNGQYVHPAHVYKLQQQQLIERERQHYYAMMNNSGAHTSYHGDYHEQQQRYNNHYSSSSACSLQRQFFKVMSVQQQINQPYTQC